MYNYFVIFAVLLASIGIFGIFLNRRSLIVAVMSMELVFLSAISIIIVTAHLTGDESGLAFALLCIAIIAADTAIGVTILVAVFKSTGNTVVDDINTVSSENNEISFKNQTEQD